MVTDAETGAVVGQIRYSAYGEERYTSGMTPTDYRYTGQLSRLAEIGLYHYGARWFDPEIAHFVQADTVVPDASNPATFDRFAYTRNNPIRYNDPMGHDVGCSAADPKCKSTNTISPPKITKPYIISRRNWGALVPGSKGGGEGLFNRESNPGGYAKYSDLYPSKSLSDVLDTVVFHHEGNQQTYDVAQVQKDEMEGGAYDIAYHYVVGADGSIYEGRDIGVRGAHVPDTNSGKIGILWLGDFEPGMAFESGLRLPFDINGNDPRPTTAQIEASVNLVSWLDQEYGIDSAYGHTELYRKSVCPGSNAMPFISIFRALVQEIR
ncbi:protein containing RHS repeat-associated core domain [Anaerolinea thermolimosa]|nr:protein containing RHS repeat-associated core domain [Anaerolinea thermolimosa]